MQKESLIEDQTPEMDSTYAAFVAGAKFGMIVAIATLLISSISR